MNFPTTDDAVRFLRGLRCGYSAGSFFWEPVGETVLTEEAVRLIHPNHEVVVQDGLVWALPKVSA